MKKNPKKLDQAMNDNSLEKVSGGLTEADITMLYGEGFKLKVRQEHFPEIKAKQEGGTFYGHIPEKCGTYYSWTRGGASFSQDDIEKVLDIMKQNP